MNNNTSISTHNQTIPTTVGALLTEEWTIDPLSHLPSFLELTFVDVARNSGRKALSAAWGVGIVWLEGVLDRLHRLERLVDRRLALRLNSSNSGSTSSSSTTLAATKRLLNIIRTLTAHIQRIRVKLLKSLCHTFLKTIKSLGPEIQTLIMYAIDYNCMHYLAGATACEMVYGLKRSKIVKKSAKSNNVLNQKEVGGSKVTDLTKFDKTISALLAALLPYCKERCDQLYSEWKEDEDQSNTTLSGQSLSYHHITPNNHNINSITNQSRATIGPSSKQQYMQIYPYFHMLHEGSIFLYQFAYLLGYTPYWSFSLHALGVMLRRMTVADVQQQQKEKQLKQQQQQLHTRQKESSPTGVLPSTPSANTATKTTLLQSKQLTIPRLLRGAVLFSLSYTLLSGWYSHFQRELRLRRRRWIAGNEDGAANDEDDTRRKAKLPIPPPPMPPNLLNTTIDEDDMDKWSCPICKDVRINPTASTSGYVYCYKCLVLHIRQKGEYCPVTGMHCPENKVVRLFEPTATSRGGAS